MTVHAASKELVREAVVQTLQSFGIDVSDPDSIIKFQRDMHYLRDIRLQSETNKGNAIRKGIEYIIAGIVAAIMVAFGQAVGVFRS